MPFLIYERTDVGTYRRVGQVNLGGVHGPFAQHVHEAAAGATLTWHLSEAEVPLHFHRDSERHVFVIDTDPSNPATVAIYRLRDVWGYSYARWTPIMLRLSVIYHDEPAENPAAFREEFPLPDGLGEDVFTFLYLRGGTQG